MKKAGYGYIAVPIRTTLFILLIIGVFAAFAACAPAEPVINIVLGEGGAIYAGATVPLSAEIFNLSVEDEITFEIRQEHAIASIDDNGNLVIASDAATGAVFEIYVTVSGYVAQAKFTVGKTPVESIELAPVSPLNAGDSCLLDAVIYPIRAREHELCYELVAGEGCATVLDGVLTISTCAKYSDDIRIVAKAGGKQSAEITIEILTVPAEGITFEGMTVYADESFPLTAEVFPLDTTDTDIEYTILSGGAIAHIDNGQLIVDISAEVGASIKISASAGVVSTTAEFVVDKKKAEEVFLRAKYYENYEVMLFETRELEVEIAPFNATVTEYEIVAVRGEALIDYDADTRTFTVTCGNVGDEIAFKASSDGIESEELVFVIVKTPVLEVILSADGESIAVAPEECRTIIAEVLPITATYPNVRIEIECDVEDCYSYSDGVLTFYNAPTGTKVILTAHADGVDSAPLIFTITPVPVSSVTISTTDSISDLKGGDVVRFDAEVLPLNATQKQLVYNIVSGSAYASITDNGVLTVSPNAVRGAVTIKATSEDGVESNIFTVEIFGTYYEYNPTSWAELDNVPNKFNGEAYRALWLNLKSLPLDAQGATIVISSDVQNLIIEGGYSGTMASCVHNLKFYFLTTQSVYVTFLNLGIIASERFGGTVIDFGTEAEITLEIASDSYIEAGSPYAPYVNGFTVDGEWSELSTNYIRKHGMDGYGGYDGGTAISARSLRITGTADLTVKAGSGSSGTSGGAGANTPQDAIDEKAGDGGRGGYGGNSGYAIFANILTIESMGTIFAYGGDGGTGGAGGAGGIGISAANNGAVGASGAAGSAFAPLYAYTDYRLISGTVNSIYIGRAVAQTKTRSDSYTDFASKLEKQYKVDIHYGIDFYNPYAPTFFSWKDKYRMTQQNSAAEILRLLYGLEGAFTMFPQNSFIELSIVNALVNVYLVNTITNSSGGTVYGLTSNANNMWFATFDTRLRDTFYSTYYNIMVHEMLHLFTFSMGSTSSNPMKSGLPAFNLGYPYNSGNSNGVYNPVYGNSGENSAFLTRYSKTDFNEDISDNMSLVAMLVYRADFLDDYNPIHLKAKYIANTYRNFYKSFAYYMPTSWERFIFE